MTISGHSSSASARVNSRVKFHSGVPILSISRTCAIMAAAVLLASVAGGREATDLPRWRLRGAVAVAASPSASTTLNVAMAQMDSVLARQLVERYLNALAEGKYSAAAQLFVGEWQAVAKNLFDSVPAGMDYAGFLERACAHGGHECRLRLRSVLHNSFIPPDTLVLTITYRDSAGRPFRWGPCCSESGVPDSTNKVVVVRTRAGYRVRSLPLYIP